jgi:hypothetical protein
VFPPSVHDNKLAQVVDASSGRLANCGLGRCMAEECVLTADLDWTNLAWAKFDFDVVGHYARPGVFRLEVNEQPMKSVVFGGRLEDAATERHTP